MKEQKHRAVWLSFSGAIVLIVAICHHAAVANATAVAPSKTCRRSNDGSQMEICTISAATADAVATPSVEIANSPSTTDASSSSNPIIQLLTYLKSTMVNFKNGLGQMSSDHKRCNAIRAKQIAHAKSQNKKRPRGVAGIQVGGISYEEYDFLKKGLVDRNKLLAVTVVMLCLPNYFVYYLWSFPDMMPSPFLTGKDLREISRERSHAVISTLMDIEKGARVAPWSSKLNPFGKKATERAMKRLEDFADIACDLFAANGASGPNGGKLVLQSIKDELYTKLEPKKQQLMLSSKHFPKQILKGLGKVISADPLNKGSSPFGIGPLKHIESIQLADEFLIQQNIDLDSINSQLLAEACSARLIGGPGWTDEERRSSLQSWLESMEVEPKQMKENEDLCFNGNLARATLMCYNAIDATRDDRSDSRLGRLMYQGQLKNDNVV